MRDAHFALLNVQVELVLTDGHHPDGFNQRVAGIPGGNNHSALPKRPLGHSFPVEDKRKLSAPLQPYIHNDSVKLMCYITKHLFC